MSPVRAPLPGNLFDVLSAAAERHGERDYLIIGRREEVATFRELAHRANRFGHLLAGLGVTPGDRVAIWMTNHVDWAVASYGTARCGAVVVGVNTRLSPREVAYLLDKTRPRVWILEDVFLGKVQASDTIAPVLAELRARGAREPLVLVWSASGARYPGTRDWQEELATVPDSASSLPGAAELIAKSGEGDYPEAAGVAVILSTSGTTGAPKGVMLGHEGLIKLAAGVAERQELGPTQRFYSVAPFFHCSGYMHGLLTNLIAGSTYFSTQRYLVDELWDVFRSERINAYHGFVLPLQEMTHLPGYDHAEIAAFDRAWYSAPATLMQDLEQRIGAKMCEVYGLTETGGNVSICRTTDPVAMRHDSDGRPHEGIEVMIVDPATRQSVPDGTPGELCVRGWNVMRGYFRDAEATAKTIDEEGWLHTGDQGVRLSDGFIKFLSRIKDVIRVGGENLSPLEVEEVLIGHPAVQEVAVVAGPHPRMVEVPVAFIVRRGGVAVTAEELEAYCRERLANFKVPTRFVFMDALIRTSATMRVQKAALRELLTAETHG